jgi:hypothetical protein
MVRYNRHDVMLNPEFFRLAKKELHYKPSVDMFASADHHQVPRYYSRESDPHSVGTDAFKADWRLEATLYLNPPWPLIGACLKRLVALGITAMFVAPVWPSIAWWRLFEHLSVKQLRLTEPVFLNADGSVRPKPTWDTVIAILDGSRGLPPARRTNNTPARTQRVTAAKWPSSTPPANSVPA